MANDLAQAWGPDAASPLSAGAAEIPNSWQGVPVSIVDFKTVRYTGPAPSDLDERGRQLYLRAFDLLARRWINDAARPQYEAGNFTGSATLVHIEHYLTDRLARELAPWPKG